MIIIKKENIFDLFNEQHLDPAPSVVLPVAEVVSPTEPETVQPTEPETVQPTNSETSAPPQVPALEPAPPNESEVNNNV